jgi:hypothetical protein
MIRIDTVKDTRQTFAEGLEAVMRKKQIFDPDTHSYLANLMQEYVNWREHEQLSEERDCQKVEHDGITAQRAEFDDLKPTVNTRNTRAFIFQLTGIGERPEYVRYPELRCERLKRIGETLLFAVGYWPESVAPKPHRPYVPMEYYAKQGMSAYSMASGMLDAMSRMRTSSQSMLLKEMSDGFIAYAAVLYQLRHEMGDKPVKDAWLILKMSELLGDRSVEKKYLIGTEHNRRIIN